MAIPYPQVRVQVALRSGQLDGSDQTTLEAAYTGAWATAIDGAELPITAIRDTILAVEKELAHIVASNASHPYRDSLYGISASLADNALIPTVDATSKAFIGLFSGVTDTTDSKPLTEMPVQIVDDTATLGASIYPDTQFYYYCFSGNRIRHTRTNVKISGCVWDRTTQLAQYALSNGNSPLPQVLENTLIAGVLASLPQVAGFFMAESGYYASVYQSGIAMLSSGAVTAASLPDNTANAVPGKN